MNIHPYLQLIPWFLEILEVIFSWLIQKCFFFGCPSISPAEKKHGWNTWNAAVKTAACVGGNVTTRSASLVLIPMHFQVMSFWSCGRWWWKFLWPKFWAQFWGGFWWGETTAVDGRNPAITSWSGKDPIIYRVWYIPGGWEWDFWTINSTLPETNSSHLKMDGWNTNFLSGPGLFSGANLLLVSGFG